MFLDRGSSSQNIPNLEKLKPEIMRWENLATYEFETGANHILEGFFAPPSCLVFKEPLYLESSSRICLMGAWYKYIVLRSSLFLDLR